jgi:hypothetical protein
MVKTEFIMTVVLLLGIGAADTRSEKLAKDKVPDKTPPKAGWSGVFPTLGNYQRTFQAPVINKDKTVYQQSAQYSWMGGDYRVATATLARDPQFKEKHATPVLMKAGAKKIKIGKMDAWFTPGQGKDRLKKRDKIIVPLGEDKALIVEGIGVAHKDFPLELAGRFDPEKCAAALQQPPTN